MNAKVTNLHRGSSVEEFFNNLQSDPTLFPRGFQAAYVDVGEDPDPPDNFDIWNSFPEDFREKIANQFTRGIDNEYVGIRARVQSEYAVARARQKERDERRNRPAPRRGRR